MNELQKDEDDGLPSDSVSGQSTLVDTVLGKLLLQEILGVLDKEEKILFVLRFHIGYSEKEIAESRKISRQAVNKRLKRIKKKITEHLDAENKKERKKEKDI